jgi:hypothetical protein
MKGTVPTERVLYDVRLTRPRQSEGTVFLIQMLLPERSANGAVVADDLLRKTRVELLEQFGGLTAYRRSPASGGWIAPDGDIEHDHVVMLEVMAEAFDKRWWREYTAILETRFSQESIHVRASAVETLAD